jgi:GAF domain-containing protein
MAEGRLEAAVAAAVLPAEQAFGELLRSITLVARAIFGAKAASIFLLDEETDELVFAAVAGEDEQGLVGRRMPSSEGIAGWVISSRTPLVLSDVQNDPRWSRGVAEQTGYAPKGMMAVPLLHEDDALGVLQVLDRPAQATFSLAEMELLGLFATQAAAALSVLRSVRRARATVEGEADTGALTAVAAAVERLEEPRRGRALALLEALARVL